MANIKEMPVVAYARAHTEAAILVLVDMMHNADKDATKVAAANAILNRAWGTPMQSLNVTGERPKEFDMSNMTPEELRTFHELLSKINTEAEVVRDGDKEADDSKMKNVTPIRPEPVEETAIVDVPVNPEKDV